MKRFCAKCGIEENHNIHIISGLCPKCFIETYGISEKPKDVEVKYCGKCGAIFLNNKWDFYEDNNIKEIISMIILGYLKTSERVKIIGIDVDVNLYENTITKVKLIVELDNKFRSVYELPICIRWIKTTCSLCLKKIGGGYNSVIQLRYINQDISVIEFIEEIAKYFGEYIADIEEVQGGYDIKLIDTHIAKRIAGLAQRKWRNTRVIETHGDIKKLRDGTRRSRLYISIRILNFKQGDYIVLDGKPYRVKEVGDKDIVIVDQNDSLHRVEVDKIVLKYTKSRIKHKTL